MFLPCVANPGFWLRLLSTAFGLFQERRGEERSAWRDRLEPRRPGSAWRIRRQQALILDDLELAFGLDVPRSGARQKKGPGEPGPRVIVGEGSKPRRGHQAVARHARDGAHAR